MAALEETLEEARKIAEELSAVFLAVLALQKQALDQRTSKAVTNLLAVFETLGKTPEEAAEKIRAKYKFIAHRTRPQTSSSVKD